MLPAMLHGRAALAPSCLKNCDQDAAGESIHRGYGVGKGQVQQEGAQVQQRIVVRSMKSVQAQKKWNEVQKIGFLFIELNSISGDLPGSWRSHGHCRCRKVAELGPVCKSWKISIEPKEKNHTIHRWCPYVYGFSGDCIYA